MALQLDCRLMNCFKLLVACIRKLFERSFAIAVVLWSWWFLANCSRFHLLLVCTNSKQVPRSWTATDEEGKLWVRAWLQEGLSWHSDSSYLYTYRKTYLSMHHIFTHICCQCLLIKQWEIVQWLGGHQLITLAHCCPSINASHVTYEAMTS